MWFKYTDGNAAGSLTLAAPTLPGQYEFKYLLNDSERSIITSNRVTVSATTSSTPVSSSPTSSFNPTCQGATYYGGLSDTKRESILPNESGFYAGTGNLFASMKINGDTNIKYALQKKQLGFLWNTIAESSGSGAVQTISKDISDGTYRWHVTGSGGNSNFALCSVIQ